MTDKLYTARRVVDFPEFYGGGYDLVTGRRTAQHPIAKSPTAYACMNIRAHELANLPWHIYKNDKIVDKHPLIDMLKDFGPEGNYQKEMAGTELDQFQYGAGLWFRDVDVLRRLDPDTIKVDKTRDGITSFTQTINGKIVNVFQRDEIVYFHEYHPEDQLGYGIPVLEVCKKSIKAEIEALLMIEAYFRNDAVPGLFLGTDQDVTEKEANRLLAWWNKRFRGSRNKAKVGVAGKGLKPIPVGDNMKNAAVIEILEYAVNDICKTFRVDPMLVGQMKSATYVNLEESRKFLIEDVITPRAVEYQNVINQDLCNKVDPSVEFKFAPEELPILQEDNSAKWLRIQGALASGVIGKDFAREEMGWPMSAAPTEAEEAEKKAAQAESKFEKKAVKAFLRGDDPNVEFESDNIPIDRQYLLHGRLSNAKDLDAVRACFR